MQVQPHLCIPRPRNSDFLSLAQERRPLTPHIRQVVQQSLRAARLDAALFGQPASIDTALGANRSMYEA
jgi:hypothetical protein